MGCRSPLHHKLNEFRCDEKYCDITIQVQNTPMKCHRAVLAAVSEFFDVMFCSPFIENRKEEISLPAVDSLAFECILEFAYVGRVPNFFDPKNDVFEILKACDFLRIFDVAEFCVSHIIEQVSSIENVCEIFLFSCVSNYRRLSDALSSYIAENFFIVSQKEDFLLMPYEQLNMTMKKYKALNNGTVCSTVIFRDEDLLLDTIIRWILHVFQDRKRYFLELVSIVNFEKVSKNYIEFLSNVYKVNLRGFADLKSCLKAFFTLQTKDVLPSAIVYKNPSKNLAIHLFVSFSNRVEKGISILSLSKYQPIRQWPSKRKLIGNISKAAIVALNEPYNYLYCLSLEERSFSSYSSISLNEKKTLKIPPLDYSVFSRMCGFQNNSIYLYDYNIHFGVSSGTRDIVSILNYKCDADEWFTVPNLKTKMFFSKMVADNKLVYLIGGVNVDERTCHAGYVQAFDYRVPRWLELTRLDTTISSDYHASYCFLNGKMYASDTTKIEVFDFEAGKWKILSHNPYSQSMLTKSPNMVPFENKLWIYSSFSPDILQTYTIFDPDTLIWYPDVLFFDYNLHKYLSNSDSKESELLENNFKYSYDVEFLDHVVFNSLDD